MTCDVSNEFELEKWLDSIQLSPHLMFQSPEITHLFHVAPLISYFLWGYQWLHGDVAPAPQPPLPSRMENICHFSPLTVQNYDINLGIPTPQPASESPFRRALRTSTPGSIRSRTQPLYGPPSPVDRPRPHAQSVSLSSAIHAKGGRAMTIIPQPRRLSLSSIRYPLSPAL